MPYVQNTKIRVGRVRVTARLTSKPDHRGLSTIIAREGEEMSAEEAFRRSIPAKHLEPLGPGGDQLLESYRKALSDKDSGPDILAEAREAARRAEMDANQQSDLERSNAAGRRDNSDQVGEFPQHRGGGTWLLSNGDTFRGKKEEAEEAEAALDTEQPQSFAEELQTVEGVSEELAAAIADQLARDELAAADRDGQLEQLQTVEGVGEATATSIVDSLFS